MTEPTDEPDYGPRAQARVDCPQCGERILDVNIFDFAANMTAEQFGRNVDRLVAAHIDACTPKKFVAPADRPRRRRWAILNYGVPVMWAMFAVLNGAVGNGWGAVLAWATGAGVLLIKVFEEKSIFQRGYLRGFTEARVGLPTLPSVNIHPADKWRRPPGMDEQEERS